jgi:hypothetical protein
MGKSYIENRILDANNVDDINSVIANCGVHIGSITSRLIDVFREYFPEATLNWNCGCTFFRINGIGYEMTKNYYVMNDAPKFYKSYIYN